MDGTSLDSELLVVVSWVELYRRFAPGRKLSLMDLEAFSGPPLLDSCKKAFPDLDPEMVKNAYIEISDPLYPLYATLFPYEKEALAEIKKMGAKLAINTNKLRKEAVMALEEQGISSLFDAVVAGGDAPMKPDPTGVLSILSEFSIKKEDAVYLGDSRYDYLTAKNAGIPFFAVDFYPRRFLEEEKPERFVSSYRELSSILSSWWN